MRDIRSHIFGSCLLKVGTCSKTGKIYWSKPTPTQVLEFWGDMAPAKKRKTRKKRS